MDRFVIRTPRPERSRPKIKTPERELKQVTILSLKRVVVVEDIQRCKVLLEIEDQDKQVVIEQLNQLEQKIPSKEVLEETKIGLTLNKLRKHSDEEISTKANKIYRSWKQHFKDKLDKPKIEVRFDHATNKYRSSSRKLLEARLHPHKESAKLAEAIERTVYQMNSNTGPSYRRQTRDIVFTLQYHQDIRDRFLNKQLTVTELCQIKKKS